MSIEWLWRHPASGATSPEEPPTHAAGDGWDLYVRDGAEGAWRLPTADDYLALAREVRISEIGAEYIPHRRSLYGDGVIEAVSLDRPTVAFSEAVRGHCGQLLDAQSAAIAEVEAATTPVEVEAVTIAWPTIVPALPRDYP